MRHLSLVSEEQSGLQLIEAVLNYLFHTGDHPSPRQAITETAKRLAEPGKEFLMSYASRLRDEGREEGLMLGLERGREEGLVLGREAGLEEGREAGLEEGREEGIRFGVERVARDLIREGFALDYVAKVTSLPMARLEELS